MDIAALRLERVDFPGRAGELQRDGATASLVRELGDNYAEYHRFLSDEVRKVGGQPSPKVYRDDPGGYAAHWAQLEAIATAELVLRRALAHRKLGRPLGQAADSRKEPPLFDESDRLISIEEPDETAKEPPNRSLPPYSPSPSATVDPQPSPRQPPARFPQVPRSG